MSTTATPRPSLFTRVFINRNVPLLALAQALATTINTLGLTTTPLAAFAMLGPDEKALATIPLVFTHLGLMAGTFPASLLMERIGRRAGFALGSLFGIAAGLVGVAAIYQQSMWMLCLTAFLQGIAISFAWYYRFAAADAAPPNVRARAISLVLFGGIISGVVGAETAKWAKDLLAPVTFAGVYAMYGVFCVANLILLSFLDIPKPTRQELSEPARPLSQIAQDPRFIVAVLSSMMGYGVMTTLMAATPLAMMGCGFTFEQGATVIQFHVIGMFAPALFTGHLIQRFGVLTIIGTGAAILIGCVLVAMAGIAFHNFLIANLLVGIGWNFCFIGGSTLLTTVYRTSERAKTQAAHDFLEFATTAVTTGLSGAVLAWFGWEFVNLLALPMIVVVLVAATWLYLRQGHIEITGHKA
jgi:MFS family permease